MKIKDLFLRNIARHINPAVTVDSFTQDTVNAEIEEYIFTDELIEKQYAFLYKVFNKKEGKTGVWINGYYGSGKSHFIKFAHYLMNNANSLAAFERYSDAVRKYKNDLSDVTEANLDRLKKQVAQSKAETIIFNIEAVTSNTGKKKDRLTRIFINQLNRHRGFNAVNIPVAIFLEKHLYKIGKFELFKQQIKAHLNADWNLNSNDLVHLKLKRVLEIAHAIDNEIDVEHLRNKIALPDDVSIKDHLIPELLDFLADKPENFRLVFMVDEISQYIGNDIELLLNLQTIVEAIEVPCQHRVWLVATAQQTLDDVVGTIKNSNTVTDHEAVGKILGRFDTRISLESQSASFITQKRILDKNESASEEISHFYSKNKEEIHNKFVFLQNAYKSYNSADDFLLAYPFIPYQFKLISDVFDAFSAHEYVIREVKDNERSVLGITHKTIKLFTDNDLGDFVPFDAFFNDTFNANLTHKARRIIQKAWDADFIKKDPFAKRVVNALFMISNISDVNKVKFSANLDNLVILLITKLDENRNELQSRIQEVLANMVADDLIFVENGNYFFYKEDEMDVATIIKNTPVSTEDRFTYFNDLLKDILRNDSKVAFNQNTISLNFFLDEKQFNQKADLNVKFLVFTPYNVHNLSLANDDNSLLFCLYEWFLENSALHIDFMNYSKTMVYMKLYSIDMYTERKATNERFQERNKKLKASIIERIRKHFIETKIISGHQIISPEQITANSPDKYYQKALEKHFENIFKYNKLSEAYATSVDMLKANARNTQTSTDNELTNAEQRLVNEMERAGNEISLADLVATFGAPPFGWKDNAVIDMVRALAVKKAANISYRNDERLEISEFIDKALRTTERRAIIIKPGDKIGIETINQVIASVNSIFNKRIPDFTDAHNLTAFLRDNLFKEYMNKFDDMLEHHGRWIFTKPVRQITNEFKNVLQIRDIKKFFEAITANESEYRRLFDLFAAIEDFVKDNLANYKAIASFAENNIHNKEHLSAANAIKLDEILRFYKTEENPTNDFRTIKRHFTDISKEIEELIEAKKQECNAVYALVAEKLKSELTHRNLPENLLADCKLRIAEIERIDRIERLQLLIAEATKFTGNQVQNFIDLQAKQKLSEEKLKPKPEPVLNKNANSAEVTSGNSEASDAKTEFTKQPAKRTSAKIDWALVNKKTSLNSEQEINEYVENLRKHLLELLNDADSLII